MSLALRFFALCIRKTSVHVPRTTSPFLFIDPILSITRERNTVFIHINRIGLRRFGLWIRINLSWSKSTNIISVGPESPSNTTGPDNNNGSSLGDAGGIEVFRSTFGGSFFTEGISTFNVFLLPFALSAVPPPSFAFGLMLRPPTDFRLLDFEIVGVTVTSLGGVNTSLAGSYGGMGVTLLLPLAERRALLSAEEVSEGTGRMKSASGFVKCGDYNIHSVEDVDSRLVGVAHR